MKKIVFALLVMSCCAGIVLAGGGACGMESMSADQAVAPLKPVSSKPAKAAKKSMKKTAAKKPAATTTKTAPAVK